MKYRYSIGEMIFRLLKKATPIRSYLLISTLASIIGNLSRVGLMGLGAMWILAAYGMVQGSVTMYALSACISGILIAVCRYLEGVYSHRGAYGLLAAMRVDLYEEIDSLSPAYLIDHKMGDLLNTATGDIEQLEFFFAHMIGPMFTVILLPLISVVIAWQFNPLYAWILIPVFILISIVIPLIALEAGRKTGQKARASQSALKANILESIYGMEDIQIYNASQSMTQQMLEKNAAVNKAAHGLKIHRSLLTSVPDFFIYAVRILILAAGGYLAVNRTGDPAGAIVVSFIASASFSSTFSLTTVVTNLLETFASAERIFTIEDAKPAVTESKDAKEISTIESIEFKNVTFAYPGTEKEILKNVSFTIHKGDKVGLIGDSGAGKSTILRLLLRFYDPDEGEICINHIDLKEIAFHSLHDHVSLLEQDTYLFADSIAANILTGKPDADQNAIKKAARRAGIHDFIETLPDGYETNMGSMNARVSGGERQRIGLARILLKNSDFMIFDEPTSALDVLHEKEFLHTLHEESRNQTVLMISHRISSLAECTRIFKLSADGQLQELANTKD